jgi:hypothetical protein
MNERKRQENRLSTVYPSLLEEKEKNAIPSRGR